MKAPVIARIDAVPTTWCFTTKLRIGLGYFNRFLTNSVTILMADILALVLAFDLAALLRYLVMGKAMDVGWVLWAIGFWVSGAFAWKILPGWGLSSVESLRRQFGLTLLVFGAAAATLFITKSGIEHSRFTFLAAYILAIPLIPSLRLIAKSVLIRSKIWGQPVAVYGGGKAGTTIIRRLLDEPGEGYYPVCVFDDDPRLQGTHIHGIPVKGDTSQIACGVPVAVVAMTQLPGDRLDDMMESTFASYLRVMIIPTIIHTPSIWATSKDLSGTPSLELKNNLLDPGKRLLKGSVEMLLSVFTFPLWGSLCAAIAGLIWLEDHKSPIFRQRRVGERGGSFDTLKFRTMVPDAEKVLEQSLQQDPALAAEWQAHCKLREDPRITRVGKFLRKTSLDEIPQLFNVLKGEMSLVGPRPLPRYHYDQLPGSVRMLRERVKPGITGLWQVSGRSDAGNEGMIRHDPYYVRNWSIWLDIVILVRTVRAVLFGSGAR